MLCEVCKQRDATIHLGKIDGAVVQHRHFCETCFDASNSTMGRDLSATWEAGCNYCGGEPHIGGLDAFEALSGSSKIAVMCERCADEYFGFLNQTWPGFGEVTIMDKQIANINKSDTAAVFREAEEHMSKWVAKRLFD